MTALVKFHGISLPLSLVLLLVILCTLLNNAVSFEWAVGGRPKVTKRTIAGLWKLLPPPPRPLKEFTVYPKKKTLTIPANDEAALLLLLKDDGSFEQIESDNDDTASIDESSNHASAAATTTKQSVIQESWQRFQRRHKLLQENECIPSIVKGTWDYRDGRLILATQRAEHNPDTLLEGQVVASYAAKLTKVGSTTDGSSDIKSIQDDIDNIRSSGKQAPPLVKNSDSKEEQQTELDTMLSVPKGHVQVGKFFYPTKHPNFFDQPMFMPKEQGSFQLFQVLGSNKELDQDVNIRKFRQADFYNKTFSLTSYPIPTHKPKGEARWSIKYNKFVHDPPRNKDAAKALEEEKNRPASIRVMNLKFFTNNTFATVAGTGEAILRGKFDVIGQDYDQFWMQVVRFGFGRSVSGSVYSEGRMLTHDDAKAYWGTIKHVNVDKTINDGTTGDYKSDTADVDENVIASGDTANTRTLRVDGSVMFGFGLEPTPVGRFIMREMSAEEQQAMEEDYDEDDDDDNEKRLDDLLDQSKEDSDGIDWSAGSSGFE